jgi:enamine deaminase RidA (YjgF/YER057c/UK114 family)
VTAAQRPARRHISSGSSFEALAGYSRAVVDGDWVHVSGTTGWKRCNQCHCPLRKSR